MTSRLLIGLLLFFLLPLFAFAEDAYSRGEVILQLEIPNSLSVSGQELTTKDNPKGEGVFVYDPRTSFSGVTRNLIWLVLDGEVFPLNGPSKTLTPKAKWPRDADSEEWEKTKLDPYSATEAIKIVFN